MDDARFSIEEIVEFAGLAGDFNPLHHDEGTFYISDPALY